MSGLDNERFFPAPPDDVYAALQHAVPRIGARVKSTDNFSRAITISTPASGFSWGATMSAQVIPAGEGAYVRVGGAAKVRTNITAKSAEYKNTIRLLDDVSVILQHWQNVRESDAGS